LQLDKLSKCLLILSYCFNSVVTKMVISIIAIVDNKVMIKNVNNSLRI